MVTVPGNPGKDMAVGTLNNILKQAGLKPAFSPDVPGCGSVGDTKEEVERNIQEAIEFHLEGLREEGYPIPEPSSYSSYVDIAA